MLGKAQAVITEMSQSNSDVTDRALCHTHDLKKDGRFSPKRWSKGGGGMISGTCVERKISKC